MLEVQQPLLICQSSTSKQKESFSYMSLEQIKYLHKSHSIKSLTSCAQLCLHWGTFLDTIQNISIF